MHNLSLSLERLLKGIWQRISIGFAWLYRRIDERSWRGYAGMGMLTLFGALISYLFVFPGNLIFGAVVAALVLWWLMSGLQRHRHPDDHPGIGWVPGMHWALRTFDRYPRRLLIPLNMIAIWVGALIYMLATGDRFFAGLAGPSMMVPLNACLLLRLEHARGRGQIGISGFLGLWAVVIVPVLLGMAGWAIGGDTFGPLTSVVVLVVTALSGVPIYYLVKRSGRGFFWLGPVLSRWLAALAPLVGAAAGALLALSQPAALPVAAIISVILLLMAFYGYLVYLGITSGWWKRLLGPTPHAYLNGLLLFAVLYAVLGGLRSIETATEVIGFNFPFVSLVVPFTWLTDASFIPAVSLFTFCFVLIMRRSTHENGPYSWGYYVVTGVVAGAISLIVTFVIGFIYAPETFQGIPGLDRLTRPSAFVVREYGPEMLLTIPIDAATSPILIALTLGAGLLPLALLLQLRGGLTSAWRVLIIGIAAGLHLLIPLAYPMAVWANDALTMQTPNGDVRPLSSMTAEAFSYGIFPQPIFQSGGASTSAIHEVTVGGVPCLEQTDPFDPSDNDDDGIPDVLECRYAATDVAAAVGDTTTPAYLDELATYVYGIANEDKPDAEAMAATEAKLAASHERAMRWGPWGALVMALLVGPLAVAWDRPRGVGRRMLVGALATGLAAGVVYMLRMGTTVAIAAGSPIYELALLPERNIGMVLPLATSVFNTMLWVIYGLFVVLVSGMVIGALTALPTWLPWRSQDTNDDTTLWAARFGLLLAPLLTLVAATFAVLFNLLGETVGDLFRQYGAQPLITPETFTTTTGGVLIGLSVLAQANALWQLARLERRDRRLAYELAGAAWVIGLLMTVFGGFVGIALGEQLVGVGGLLVSVMGLEMLLIAHRLLRQPPRPRPKAVVFPWLSAGAWASLFPALMSATIVLTALKMVLADVVLIVPLNTPFEYPVGIRDISQTVFGPLSTVTELLFISPYLLTPMFFGVLFGWALSGDRAWRWVVVRLLVTWRWLVRRSRVRHIWQTIQRVPRWVWWVLAILFYVLVMSPIRFEIDYLRDQTLLVASVFMLWAIYRNRESLARTRARLALLGTAVLVLTLPDSQVLGQEIRQVTGGVTRLERNTSERLTFDVHQVGQDLDYNLYEDVEGTVWFSSNGIGLTQYDPAANSWRRFDVDQINSGGVSESGYPTDDTQVARLSAPWLEPYIVISRGSEVYFFNPDAKGAVRFQQPGAYMLPGSTFGLTDISYEMMQSANGSTCDAETAAEWGLVVGALPSTEALIESLSETDTGGPIPTPSPSLASEAEGPTYRCLTLGAPAAIVDSGPYWVEFAVDGRGTVRFSSPQNDNRWTQNTLETIPRSASRTDITVSALLYADERSYYLTDAGLEYGSDTTRVLVETDAVGLRHMAYDETTDTLWVGGESGLYRVEASADVPSLESVREDIHVTVLEIGTDEVPLLRSDRHLWIGTTNGLIAYDPEGGDEFVLVTGNADLATNRVTDILSDSRGTVWVTTYEDMTLERSPLWGWLFVGLFFVGGGWFTARDYRHSPTARGRALGRNVLAGGQPLYSVVYEELVSNPQPEIVLGQLASVLQAEGDLAAAESVAALLQLCKQPDSDTLAAYTKALSVSDTHSDVSSIQAFYRLIWNLLRSKSIRDITGLELAATQHESGLALYYKGDTLEVVPNFLPGAQIPFWEKLSGVGAQLRKYQEVEGTGDRLSYLAAALGLADEAGLLAADIDAPDGPMLVKVTRQWREIINASIGSISGHAELQAELRTRQVRRGDIITVVLRLFNRGQTAAENLRVELTLDDVPAGDAVTIARLSPDRSTNAEFVISPPDGELARAAFTITWDDRTGTDHTISYADEVRLYVESSDFQRIQNPYIVGHPVKEAAMFFGREDIFNFIEENISGSVQDRTIVLYGQRRTGKTSLLYQLVNGKLGERYIPILVDMQELALLINQTEDMLGELAYAIERALTRADVTVTSLDSDSPSTRAFNRYLDTVETALGERKAILIFDEFELIESKIDEGKLAADFLGYLRSMVQHRSRFVFMFTGTHRLEEMSQDYWSILFNIALYRQVSYLNEAEAVALIRGPVREALTVDDIAVEKILRLTHRHPYFIQLMCWALVNQCNERSRNYATINDVNDALEQILTTGEGHFAYIWQQISSREQLALGLLAHTLRGGVSWARLDDMLVQLAEVSGDALDRDTMLQVLDRLVQQDIIDVASEGVLRYRFRLEVLQQWITRTKSIALLVERLVGE
jgi:archaellum biogenesis ATPase FlaH